jgi:hypothetical protein
MISKSKFSKLIWIMSLNLVLLSTNLFTSFSNLRITWLLNILRIRNILIRCILLVYWTRSSCIWSTYCNCNIFYLWFVCGCILRWNRCILRNVLRWNWCILRLNWCILRWCILRLNWCILRWNRCIWWNILRRSRCILRNIMSWNRCIRWNVFSLRRLISSSIILSRG